MYSVLVVDDDPLIPTMVCRMLRTMGYEAQEAHDGAAAVVCVGEAEPDLILTDIQMPVMDGVELLQTLRTRNCGARIVAMSGNHDDALAQGFDGFLKKPFRMTELVRTVDAALATIPVR